MANSIMILNYFRKNPNKLERKHTKEATKKQKEKVDEEKRFLI